MTLGNFEHTYSALGYVVFVLMCVSVCIQHSDAQQLLWQRVFDSGVEDCAEGITTDKWGNIIVVGITIPQEIQPPNREDFLIVKYNPFGDTLWTRHYDLTVVDEAYDVTTDHIGNIIVSGCIVNDSTNADIHIVKYAPDGNILWTRTYSNGENVGEFGYGVAVDSKNSIIITGKAYYNWGDYITIKYDSSGNLLWLRTYDGRWEDYAQDVAVDDSDNVIVTGYSDSGINWDWCTIKYSTDGDTLWVRRYDVSLTDRAFGVTTDSEGNVIVVGEVRYLPGSGGRTGMVVKYTPYGDTLWTKIFTDTLQYAEVGTFVDVTTDDQGNIYLAGVYAIWDSIGMLWTDYYIAKCAPTDDTLWTTQCDVSWDDEASGIALDMWGNVIVTGTSEMVYPYGYDYVTMKLQNILDEVTEHHFVPTGFALYPNYPNPFNASTVISYQLPVCSFVSLKVFDLLGREIETLVAEERYAGIYTSTWNAARFASGVYIARLTAGNYVASQKLLLIK